MQGKPSHASSAVFVAVKMIQYYMATQEARLSYQFGRQSTTNTALLYRYAVV